MRILLIATDREASRSLLEAMRTRRDSNYHAEIATSVERALAVFDKEAFDLVLFDFREQSMTLNDLDAFLASRGGAPTIALVGPEDKELGEKAMEIGADSMVHDDEMVQGLLRSCVIFFQKHNRLLTELDNVRNQARNERELRFFYERMSRGASSSAITEEMYGALPLKEQSSETYHRLMRRFLDLMELALERQVFKVDYNLSSSLKNLAEELGHSRANPRDAVELFSDALRTKKDKVPDMKYQAYADEGRLLLLELMGYMVSFYRQYSLGGE